MTLFDSWLVGDCAMRNRIVRAATTESLADAAGLPTDRLVRLYDGLARGGAGLLITGYAFVREDGKPSPGALGMSDSDQTAAAEAYGRLVEAAHAHGARIALQLVYGGSKGMAHGDAPVLGPSAVTHPKTGIVPKEADAADLDRLVEAFADAAGRAKSFGFDGVEVHAAHGYLLSQFLSPRFNRRSDSYGGPLENRARLACRCVAAARAAVGLGYPVLVKLNSCDDMTDPCGLAGGLGEADSLAAAALLAEAGANCIEVSGDWHAASARGSASGPYFEPFGARLASTLDVPVVVTGGWRDHGEAERAVAEDGIAAIGMSRPLICEPGLPNRWRAGDESPSACVSCMRCMKVPGIPCNVGNRSAEDTLTNGKPNVR